MVRIETQWDTGPGDFVDVKNGNRKTFRRSAFGPTDDDAGRRNVLRLKSFWHQHNHPSVSHCLSIKSPRAMATTSFFSIMIVHAVWELVTVDNLSPTRSALLHVPQGSAAGQWHPPSFSYSVSWSLDPFPFSFFSWNSFPQQSHVISIRVADTDLTYDSREQRSVTLHRDCCICTRRFCFQYGYSSWRHQLAYSASCYHLYA